jgi:hypothetical protein
VSARCLDESAADTHRFVHPAASVSFVFSFSFLFSNSFLLKMCEMMDIALLFLIVTLPRNYLAVPRKFG